MNRFLLATLLGAPLIGSAAHAQYAQPAYPSGQQSSAYDYDQSPYAGGYSDSYGSSDARQDEQDDPSYPPPNAGQYRQAPAPQGYRGAPPPNAAPPYAEDEDDAHVADRNRTAALNRGYTQAGGSYAEQQARYQQQLDQHRQAMQEYRYARSRYADRIARWRARADACEAGNVDACQGPE